MDFTDLQNDLKALLPDRDIVIRQYKPNEHGEFIISLQCVEGNPHKIGERYLGNGEITDEPGYSGEDPGEHYRTIVIKNGTYFAHWLETGTIYVSVSSPEVGTELLQAMTKSLADS